MFFFAQLGFTAGCLVAIDALPSQVRNYDLEGQKLVPFETPIFTFPESGNEESTVPNYEPDFSTDDGEAWQMPSTYINNPVTVSDTTTEISELAYMFASDISPEPSTVSIEIIEMETSAPVVVMATTVPVLQATFVITTPDNAEPSENAIVSQQRIQSSQQQQLYTDFFTGVTSQPMHTPSDLGFTDAEEIPVLATFSAAPQSTTADYHYQDGNAATTGLSNALSNATPTELSKALANTATTELSNALENTATTELSNALENTATTALSNALENTATTELSNALENTATTALSNALENTATTALSNALENTATTVLSDTLTNAASTGLYDELANTALETEGDVVHAAAASQESPIESEEKTNSAAIIGGVLGGLAGIAAVAAMAAYVMQGTAMSGASMAAPILSEASPNPAYIPAEAEGMNALYGTASH